MEPGFGYKESSFHRVIPQVRGRVLLRGRVGVRVRVREGSGSDLPPRHPAG
jgi:hypothetical protein